MTTVVISDNTTGRDFTGTDGVALDEGNPTTNDAAGIYLEAQKYSTGGFKNSCLKFPGLSNIPGGSIVTGVTVSLFLKLSSGTDASYRVGLYKLLRNWAESQATWNVYSTGNNWGTAGGTNTSSDIAASASSQVTMDGGVYGDDFGYVDFTGAGLVTDVQSWIDGATNNGWLMQKDAGGSNDSSYRAFFSEEGTDAQRPKLTVIYTAGGGVVLQPPLQKGAMNVMVSM